MDENELKILLYRSYALGYESGASRRNMNDMDVCWQSQKYFFEDDIRDACANTEEKK